jgi:hypothetical protein
MRKLMAVMLLVLPASWALAQDATRPQAGAAAPLGEIKGRKEMTATVVATDPAVKTITVRGVAQGSQPETLAVAEVVVTKLGDIKAGEKVRLVLSTDPATNKETVTSIHKPGSGSDKQ